MLRLKRDDERRGVSVRRGELERVATEDRRKGDFGLHEGKIVADANPWTPAKGEEGEAVVGCLGYSLRESVGLELFRVFAPQLLVVVHQNHGKQHVYSRGEGQLSELRLVVDDPVEDYCRRI